MQNSKHLQNHAYGSSQLSRLTPVLLLALSVIALSFIAMLALPSASHAQVSISLGAQGLYDDNVFLESGDRRPSFVIVDDQFETDFQDGDVPTAISDQADGEEDSDFITNLTFSVAGSVPYFRKYMDNRIQLGAGALLFSEFDSQNRLTLDGIIETSASKHILPNPYYASISNQFSSNASDNVSFAEGTASRSSQTYILTGRLGASGVQLSRNVHWGLGYTGSYNVFLGELRFEDAAPGEFEEEGADYHTHTVGTSFDYQATRSLTLGLTADAGAQLFTNVETNDIDRETRETGDLDRMNYTTRANLRYTPNRSFEATSFVGVTLSDYLDEPAPRDFTFVNENGETETITVTREDSEANVIFGGELAYSFSPGTQILAGVDQNVGTDIDGDRITTRSVYSNAALALSDRVSLNLGARFLEFSSSDDLDQATDRLELSSSISYFLTQQTSLVLGYNFVDQNVDDEMTQGSLFTRSEEYTVNRAYVGINVGILGLPS